MEAFKNIISLIQSRKGNSTIIVLIVMTLFIGALATVIDAGMLYVEKIKLQNAVDAAALAGIAEHDGGESAIVSKAYNNAILNSLNIIDVNITLFNNNKKITVQAKKKVGFYFAKVFNMTDATIYAKASAVAAPIVATKGIKPLGIEQQDFIYGTTYTLKHGAGDGISGNYGALALGGTGSANYKYNLINGYYGDLEIGDLIKIGFSVDTEPGNMEGPTYDAITQIINSDNNTYDDLSKIPINSPRRIIVPVIDSFKLNGRDTVKIVGFAAFFLEDVIYKGGQTDIKGKFLKSLGQGEIDEYGPSFGFYGIKLVE
jgi:hypothetical protein